MAKLTKRKLSGMAHENLVLLVLEQQKKQEALLEANNGMAELTVDLRKEISSSHRKASTSYDKSNFEI